MNKERRYAIQGLILFVGITFIVRLFYIQVINTEYKLAAESNIIEKIIEYPYRGLMYDRNDELLVYNDPVYDLMIIPRKAKDTDTLSFCKLFEITEEDFMERMMRALEYDPIKPSTFMEMISNEQFARIQDQLINFPGFFVRSRTVRNYSNSILANSLGYIGEISKKQLEKDSLNYYKQGDYIGIGGLEAAYEEQLRGKRGVSYKMVNVRGIIKGAFRNGSYDTLSIPGDNLYLTVDIELQRYAEYLMKEKIGSVVAIEPASGEVLAIASSPTYDPRELTGKGFSENYVTLAEDTLKPIFNRPLSAMYSPGSMFKTVQALIALQEGVITSDQKIYSNGKLIGDLAPNGFYDVRKGIQKSSNNYFYKVFRRIIYQRQDPDLKIDCKIGLEKWKNYLNDFGIGVKPEIDLPGVTSGFAPTVEYYDKIYGPRGWLFETIYSLSIGQGELLVTPLQMANLGALLANRGYYIMPHLVKSVGNTNRPLPRFAGRNYVGIDEKHFEPVLDGMELVVQKGSGLRANIPGIRVCGKTSTVETDHGEDHSGFMAFAPRDNPKIALAVYVENAGQGARAAASIAGLLIEKYLTGSVSRKWIEDYTLKGEFIY